MIPNVKVEKRHPLVTTVHVALERAGSEQWFLLRSDAHHDNAHSDHALQRRHLELAKERKAGILDFGDLFCAMQGKWDKRADETQMRPELRGSNYLDRLVEYCAKFYTPYAPNWVLLSPGNHECLDAQTDVLTRRGWVLFRFTLYENQRQAMRLHYHHGAGGGPTQQHAHLL